MADNSERIAKEAMAYLTGWRLWRCYGKQGRHCGHQFTSKAPVCPKCGATKQHIGGVVELVPTHLLVPNPSGPIRGINGSYHLACMPTVKQSDLKPWIHHRSDNTAVVDCPRCQDTLEFQELQKLQELGMELGLGMHATQEEIDQTLGIITVSGHIDPPMPKDYIQPASAAPAQE